MIRIPYDVMAAQFRRVLESRGMAEADAAELAAIFADNSLDGVYTHGLNRFARFVRYMDEGEVNPCAKAECVSAVGALERWNGCRGIGPLNARRAMTRAIQLSKQFGIGLVALGNSNHWMRGGTYGWQAADAGCIGICWSNTTPNMPAWGGKDPRLGNNPIIFAVPSSDGEHVVVDCAMSQFSYGKLEEARLQGKQLAVPGGYDETGALTTDPAAIEATARVLPMGYWKGSGLSILLDLISTVLTGANSVSKIGTFPEEVGLSQIMIAIDPEKFNSIATTDQIVRELKEDVQSSVPAETGGQVRYPGERDVTVRKENLKLGIPVVEEKWDEVLHLT